jgi:sodium/potassium/calcium exchanger 6
MFTSKYEMPNYPFIICILSVIMSIIWIWFIANILIDLLSTIANLMNIPDIFLGMTILAYGNSLPDLILNLSFVKIGYGEMALAGSIAGPLFNILIGFGLPLLKMNIQKGTIDIEFFNKHNLINILCLGFLFGNLFSLGIHAKLSNYHLDIKVAIVRFSFYSIFFIFICLFTFIKI